MNLDEYNSKYRKYIDYIDKYRGEANAATASEVDSNANVENKNVTTCAEELTKREKIGTNRLLMIDKIKEMYGPELAAKYIEELEGHKIYKHDETSIYPYTYGAEEMVNVIYCDVTYTLALEDLYDLCIEPEELLDEEKEVYAKYPINMFIEDRNDEVGAESMLSNITPVERLIKKKRHRDMVQVKTASEDSLIVTDNHPMLVNDDIDDTVDALDCCGKQQYKSKYHFGFLNCQRLYVNEKHPDVLVDYDLGYAVGKFAGRGLFTEMGTVELKQGGLVETDKKGRCTYKCELTELPDFDMDDLYALFYDALEMRPVDILGTPSLPRTMFIFSKCFSDGILSGMYDSGYFLDNNLGQKHIKCLVTHSRKLALQIKALLRNLGEESGNVVHTEDGLYKIQINGVYATERGWNNIEEVKSVTDKMELANCDWIYDITTGSHTFICNGLWVHNCVSITMYPFLFEGLKGLGGLSKAPKNLDSFAGSFVNLVFAIAAQFAGAVSTPEFLMYMDYFVRKDYGDNYYMQPDRITTSAGVTRKRTIRDVVHDKFQQVVYSLNQPAAARGYQAVFWNIAYFDKPYFEGMFEDFVFPDASEPTWESVNWLQHEFMDWFNKERLKAELTFPVETMNLLDDGTTYVDQDQFDFAAEMYSKGHSFFTYRSGSVDSLASCCYSGDTKVLIKDNDKGVTVGYTSFEEIEKNGRENGSYKIFNNGKWSDGSLVKLPNRPMYKVVTSTNKEMHVTDNHRNNCLGGTILTKDLTTDDYIMLNTCPVDEDDECETIDPKCYGKGNDLVGSSAKKLQVTIAECFDIYYTLEGKISAIDYEAEDALDFVRIVDEKDYDKYGIVSDDSGNYYVKIKSVEQIPYDGDVYCFEMADKSDDKFTLANGIHNYNCRLRNEMQENEFSYTLGAGGVSTGSKGVMTININRLVQNAVRDGVDISAAVTDQVERVHKYLLAFDAVMKDNFNSGLLGVYNAQYISLSKQYLTVGINGLTEGAEFLGIDISPNKKYQHYVDSILSPIYDLNKRDRTDEIMFNTEQVPRMCGHKVA